MPKYGLGYVLFTTTTSTKTVLGAYMATDSTRNAEIVECIMTGSGATAAADTQHRAALVGSTFGGLGTSSAATPIPFHPTGPAALGTFAVNYSAEPTTYEGVPTVVFGFNQRGGMRWAVPQGEGYKIINAGTTDKGAGFTVISAAAGVVDADMHFWQGN